jgi:hypothetical protein
MYLVGLAFDSMQTISQVFFPLNEKGEFADGICIFIRGNIVDHRRPDLERAIGQNIKSFVNQIFHHGILLVKVGLITMRHEFLGFLPFKRSVFGFVFGEIQTQGSKPADIFLAACQATRSYPDINSPFQAGIIGERYRCREIGRVIRNGKYSIEVGCQVKIHYFFRLK